MDTRLFSVLLLAFLSASCNSPPVEPVPVQITIAPTNVEVVAGAEQSFAAAVSGADNGAVEWGASGGEVLEASGTTLVWRAPLEPGTYTVTATSVADSA